MQNPIAIIGLLSGGTIFLFVYFKADKKRKRIIKKGVETEDIIFDFSGDSEVRFNSDSINDSLHLPVIRFVTKDGLWITEKGDWSSTSLKQGGKVTVVYNSDNPKEFIYKTSSFDLSLMNYFFLVIGAGLLAVGLWLAYKFLTNES